MCSGIMGQHIDLCMICRTNPHQESPEPPNAEAEEGPFLQALGSALHTHGVQAGKPHSWQAPTRLTSNNIGNLLLVDLCAASGTLEFTGTLLHGELKDCFLLMMLKQGDIEGSIENMAIRLRAGDMAFIDLFRCQSLCFKDCKAHLLVMQAHSLGFITGKQMSRVLPEGKLRSRMLAIHLERLFSGPRPRSEAEASMLESDTVSTLLHCLQIAPPSNYDDMPWINDLRSRILTYIEENISDITLSARDITERFKISRSHLYRIFPYGGGVLRHIQNRRLDLALRCVCENPGERISVISSRYGFANDRQFHRHFLRRFEMSPGEARIHWKHRKTSS